MMRVGLVIIGERDMELLGEAREPLTSPAATQCDSDREQARPVPRRNAMEIADEVREESIGIQLLDDDLQERRRPPQRARGRRKAPHRTRTDLLAPSIGVELLFGSNGIFE